MIETVISSSILILAVILSRLLFKGKISRRFQYSLWGIVMLRLLIPVSFLPSPVSIMNLVSPVLESIGLTEKNSDISNFNKDIAADMPVIREDENKNIEKNESGYPTAKMETYDYHKTTTVPPSKKSLDGDLRLELIWICGGVVAGLWFLVVNFMFYIRLRRARVPFESGSKIPVYVVENIASPCLFGLFRPTVYLNYVAMEDKKMLHHVLTHETCHFRHLDHIWSFARVICCAIYWWNPLVWIAAFLSKADSERACDEACIKILGEENRLNYGRTLISMIAAKPSVPAVIYTATTMTGGKKSIVERLNIIVRTPKIRLSAIIATLVIVSFAAGSCFTTGTNEGKSEKNSGFSLGNYEAVEVIYVSPTSSFDPILDESENTYRYYSFEKNCFTAIDDSGNRLAYPSDYEITKIDEDSFKEDFQSEALIPDISNVLDLRRISLYTANEDDRKSGSAPTGYLMYQVDDEFWLATQNDDYIWVIYRLEPYEGGLPKNEMLERVRDYAEYIETLDEIYTPIDKDSELYSVLYPNVEKYNANFVAESDAKLIMSGEGEYIPVNYRYIDSEILGLYLCREYSFSSDELENFDSDTKWYICQCPSRYKPDDLSELWLPGGRWIDSEGWLHDNVKYFIVGENDNGLFYAGCRYFDYIPESEVMDEELKEYILSIYPDVEDSSESEDYITGLETRNIVGENLNIIATEFLISYGKAREALPDENVAKSIGFTIDNYSVSELDENDSFIIRATFSYVPANLSEWKKKYSSNDLDEEGRYTEYWEFRLQKVYSPESGSADGYVWRCTENGTGI